MRSKLLVLAAVLALPGCGLITQGTTQTVTIKSDPPGAEFQFDGEGPTLRTPYTADLPREEHTVKFKAIKGYKETDCVLRTRTSSTFYWSLLMGVIAGGVDWIAGAWQEFETEDGTNIVLKLEKSDENPEGLVYFSSNPSGATIEINKIGHGKTGILGQGKPILVIWKEGEREKTVRLTLAGYKEREVTLRRKQDRVNEDLIPLPEKVSVLFESHPIGAEVRINGILQPGNTPTVAELSWERGDTVPRKVEFRKAGYKSDERVIKDKSVTTLKGLLAEVFQPVAVRVNCAPAGALIEVDDQPWGEGPGDVTLNWSVTKRSHKIRVSRPGYEPEERTIEDSKRDIPLDIRLKPALPRLP